MRYPKPGGRRYGKAGAVLLLRVVVYVLLLGLPASLLVAVAAGVRFGGNDAPRVDNVARWTDQVLDQTAADVLDDPLSKQRGEIISGFDSNTLEAVQDQLPSADWLSAVKDEDEEVLLKTYSKPNPMAKVQEEILREWAGGREEHTSPRVLPVAVKHAGSTAGPQHLEHTSADAATEVEAEVEAEVEVAAEVEAKVAAEAEVAAQLAAQAELDAEAAAEAEPEVEEEGQVEGNEATALPNPVVEDVGAVGDGEGGATEDEGERREWTDAQKARARMWSLVRPQGVSKFINLDMISDSCQLLAGLSQHAVLALAAAQGARREQLNSHEPVSPEAEAAVVARLNMFGEKLQSCRVHERAGRDNLFLPTIPVSIRLQHTNRTNVLELETDFLPLIPRSDPVARYKTCAIVANGGIMLNAMEGGEIDAHEAVFRINYAPTTGPAATGRDLSTHVGRKTTMDFVNRPNCNMLLTGKHQWRHGTGANARSKGSKSRSQAAARDDSNRAPILVTCESPDRDARREQFLPLMMKNPDKTVWMINPEMLYTFRFVWHELRKIVERRHKGAKFNDKPMTGWTTTMMALQMCDQVDLYGFQPYRGRSDQERYHYFDNQVASLKVHSFDMAYEMYLLLAERFPLRVRAPLLPSKAAAKAAVVELKATSEEQEQQQEEEEAEQEEEEPVETHRRRR